MLGARGPSCLGSRKSPSCGEGSCWAGGTCLCAAAPLRLQHRLALQSRGVRGFGLGLGKGKAQEQGSGRPRAAAPCPEPARGLWC